MTMDGTYVKKVIYVCSVVMIILVSCGWRKITIIVWLQDIGYHANHSAEGYYNGANPRYMYCVASTPTIYGHGLK